ncbi:amidase [Pigmentiphaga soli]|uniref:Amidase n=1 Tax=Pigmentiphaga soli TaxID=1007095 RepID=A0ABP8GBV6_9BURK
METSDIDGCLARIAAREPAVRAWAHHEPGQVLRQAAGLPPRTPAMPLWGVPVAVKDIIDTADMPTECGSRALAGRRPAADAAVVRRLREAGAVIMGKTVTTEFAYVHPGPTANPHDPARTPGGSSSGSAAAVAAGMVPLALGTQTGGSTLRPSAYCGIVGFKPTYGALPIGGVHPLAPSMDTVGIHARSVDGARLLYEVLTGLPPAAPAGGLRRLRFAFHPGPQRDEAEEDARAVLEGARRALLAAGAEEIPLALPEEFGALSEINRLVMAYEGARALHPYYERAPSALGAPTVALIEQGRALLERAYREALATVARCRAAHAAAARSVDFLLTFSAPGEAPLAAAGTGSSVFNRPWTTLGVPAITLPAGRGAHGMPIGVQLAGFAGADLALLAAARRAETLLSTAGMP